MHAHQILSWHKIKWCRQKPKASGMVKNPPDNLGDTGSTPGSGRSPGEANGTPHQYSCLENAMDRGPGGLQSMRWQRVRHNCVTEHMNTPYHAHPFSSWTSRVLSFVFNYVFVIVCFLVLKMVSSQYASTISSLKADDAWSISLNILIINQFFIWCITLWLSGFF